MTSVTLDPKVADPTPAQIAQFERFVLTPRDPAIAEKQEQEREAALDADYERFAAKMKAEDWAIREQMVSALREFQSQVNASRQLRVDPSTFFRRMARYEIGDTEWQNPKLGHHSHTPRHYCHSPQGYN